MTTKQEMLDQSLEQYKDMFVIVKREFNRVTTVSQTSILFGFVPTERCRVYNVIWPAINRVTVMLMMMAVMLTDVVVVAATMMTMILLQKVVEEAEEAGGTDAERLRFNRQNVVGVVGAVGAEEEEEAEAEGLHQIRLRLS